LKGITLMTLVSLSMMITEFYGFKNLYFQPIRINHLYLK
jgi:hypothetical protein